MFPRAGIHVLTAAVAVVAFLAVAAGRRAGPEPDRWFMPGELGFEPGGAFPNLFSRFLLANADARGTRPGSQGLDLPPPVAGSGRGYWMRSMSGVDLTWALANGLTQSLGFSHNLDAIVSVSDYETHPEFFPLIGGQRFRPISPNAIWNPDMAREDVARRAAEVARAHFDANPGALSFGLGMNDNVRFGESGELMQLLRLGRREDSPASSFPGGWFRSRPDYSPLIFTFANRVARELERTHPDKYVGTLAYLWAENTPPFPVHPRVIPFLTADRAQGYDPEFLKEERELQKRWGAIREQGARGREQGAGLSAEGLAKAGSGEQEVGSGEQGAGGMLARRRLGEGGELEMPVRLGLYDYLEGAGYYIPRIHVRMLAENLRHARLAGFTDYYAEGLGNWGLDGPQPWVVTQLLQDPLQPVGPLLDEYYRRFFGPAAWPMRRFFEICETLWMRQRGHSFWLKHWRSDSQASVFPSEELPRLRELLDRAAETVRRTGAAGASIHERRVALVSDAFRSTELFVAMVESRDALSRILLRGGAAPAEIEAGLEEYEAARQGFAGFVEDLAGREPLAIRNYMPADHLENDPAFQARRAIQERGGGMSGFPVEIVHDGAFAGPVVEVPRIAGLEYAVPVPVGWVGSARPHEPHVAGMVGDVQASTRALRVEGAWDTYVGQDNALRGTGEYAAQVRVRGRVSVAAKVELTLTWFDGLRRQVGLTSMRLPEGEWPEFVTLEQGGRPPPGAVWVGIGIRVRRQAPGEWIEAREFSLKTAVEP